MRADLEQLCVAALIERLRAGKDVDAEFVAEQFSLPPAVACKAFMIALAIIRAFSLTDQLPPPRPLH